MPASQDVYGNSIPASKIARDEDDAARWYRCAPEQGHAWAQEQPARLREFNGVQHNGCAARETCRPPTRASVSDLIVRAALAHSPAHRQDSDAACDKYAVIPAPCRSAISQATSRPDDPLQPATVAADRDNVEGTDWRIAMSREHGSSRVTSFLTPFHLVAPVVLALVFTTPVAAQWRNCGSSGLRPAACVDSKRDVVLGLAEATLRVECRQETKVMQIEISWFGHFGGEAQWTRLMHVFADTLRSHRRASFRTLTIWRVYRYSGGVTTTLDPGYERFVSNLSRFNYLLIGPSSKNANARPEIVARFQVGTRTASLGHVYEACSRKAAR